MLLADSSRAQLEEFFRAYLRDEAVRLSPIFIHAGFFSHWITKALRIAAITVDCHVFVTPKLIERDESGPLTVPGCLVAHEAAHARQYRQEGFLRFVFNYLREYFELLLKVKKFNPEVRAEAYLHLRHEREARTVEAAYVEWRASVVMRSDAGVREDEEAESVTTPGL